MVENPVELDNPSVHSSVMEAAEWIEALALAEEAGTVQLPPHRLTQPILVLANAIGRSVPNLLQDTEWTTAIQGKIEGVVRMGAIAYRIPWRDPAPQPLTKCHSWMVCREVPFLGHQCVLLQACCTTEHGGGCEIVVYV